jgi:hypothetical protein
MRYCHDCVHYRLCEKQNTAIPVQVIEQHKDDVIHLLCHDFKDVHIRGKWKYYHKQNIAVCTNCSFERKLDVDFGKAISCPNCGAKME